MTARNFAFHDANILHPTIDGVTYGKELYINEFPLYPYLVGLVWRVFGEHLLLARLLSLTFFVIGLWHFRGLILVLSGDRTVALLSVLTASLMPVATYYASTVQRQSLFFGLLLAGTHYGIHAIRTQRPWQIVAASVAFVLATLLNPFVVYMGLPFAWLLWISPRERRPRLWRVGVLGALIVLPGVAWYSYSLRSSLSLPTGAMIAVMDHRDFLSAAHYAPLLELRSWWRVGRSFDRFVFPHVVIGMALCLYGALLAARQPRLRFMVVWALAVSLYFLVDFYPIGVVIHEYYYLNIVPPLAFFATYTLTHLGRRILALATATGQTRAVFSMVTGILAASLATVVVVLVRSGVVAQERMASVRFDAAYARIPDLLLSHAEEGEQVTIVAGSDCPCSSYLLSRHPRIQELAIRFRVVTYDRLPAVLQVGDFDSLLLAGGGRPSGAAEAARKRIEHSRHLEELASNTARQRLYRNRYNRDARSPR